MTAPRVLIAAGGTGGHVFPALAVADELRRRGWHAEWVGSDRGLESRVIPAAGIGLHVLRFAGVRGRGVSAWMSLPVRLLAALRDAAEILRAARPQVVVAFGGYVTFPVGLLARWRRIPLCVHEQNAVMGTANRWLARIARLVMTSFPTTTHAPASAVVTGNPVRAEIAAIPRPEERFAGRDDRLRILVIGGSLGASALNRAVPQALRTCDPESRAFAIRHQTGPRDLAEVDAAYREAGLEAACVAFIDDMAQAYSWADLLICRAGASTVSEVATAGVAALFVPLPGAIDDHQTANAQHLADHGAGWLLMQSSRLADDMAACVARLDRPALQQTACRARDLGRPDAARNAADLIEAATGISGVQP
jgi:UDP-N-acetylglucosamine--N-acetylmuramyl-(pentapeptide) pyrophosphoryl-undecaprenol N-acetylglucosamine transferase